MSWQVERLHSASLLLLSEGLKYIPIEQSWHAERELLHLAVSLSNLHDRLLLHSFKYIIGSDLCFCVFASLRSLAVQLFEQPYILIAEEQVLVYDPLVSVEYDGVSLYFSLAVLDFLLFMFEFEQKLLDAVS